VHILKFYPQVIRENDIPNDIHTWHEDPLALPEDRLTVAIVVLRRSFQTTAVEIGGATSELLIAPTQTYDGLRSQIDFRLETWRATWLNPTSGRFYPVI
jgi:hypothetical protein